MFDFPSGARRYAIPRSSTPAGTPIWVLIEAFKCLLVLVLILRGSAARLVRLHRRGRGEGHGIFFCRTTPCKVGPPANRRRETTVLPAVSLEGGRGLGSAARYRRDGHAESYFA